MHESLKLQGKEDESWKDKRKYWAIEESQLKINKVISFGVVEIHQIKKGKFYKICSKVPLIAKISPKKIIL